MKKIKFVPIIALALSAIVYADYSVKIFMEENFKIEPPKTIVGDTTLNPYTINRGESSTLSWNYNYLTDFNINNGINYNSTEFFGSLQLSPIRTTTYDINVKNNVTEDNKVLTLNVIQPDPVVTFTSDKYQVGVGQPVNLTWNITNSDAATIDNGIGNIALSDSMMIVPLEDTTYTLNATGFFGEKNASDSLSIDVVDNSIINSFTVNKDKFTVGESAIFNWNVSDSEGLELNPYGVVNINQTSQSVLLNTTGTFDYTLRSTNFNNSVETSSPLRLEVYGEPVINTINSESTVFSNAAFTLDWTGSNITSYSLRGNSASSGVSTTDINLGTATSRSITPTAVGSYIYTLTATNAAGATTVATRNVVVEADPTFTSVTANGAAMPTSLTLAPSAALNFVGNGKSAGAVDLLIFNSNIHGMSTTAPATAGTYTYTYSAAKTLNGVTKTSASRALTLTVSAPTPVISAFSTTRHYYEDCYGDTKARLSFSYSNATSLILYPSAPNGSGQTSSGGISVYGLTTYTYPHAVHNNTRDNVFTLRACNGTSCVTRTTIVRATDGWGSGACTSG